MIELREATRMDKELLFKWINDETVRNNSFSTNTISLDEHERWVATKLADDNCLLYIILHNQCEVGQLRIEFNKGMGIINYSIAAEHRGKGIGASVLKLIKERYKEVVLVGKVKYDNIASIKAFQKADYFRVDKENFIEFQSKMDE